MSKPRIRIAVITDASALTANNHALGAETEGLDLDRARLRRGVQAILADPGKGKYYVVESEGKIVAQLLLTYEWSDWRDGVFWWIQSVYVDKAHRRQGLFRSLYDHVLAAAKQAENVCGLRLYVERDNTHAKETYDALGMGQAAYDMYEVDFVIQRPAGEA